MAESKYPSDAFLDSLIRAGVPVGALVAHGSYNLHWLEAHAKKRFKLSYRDGEGNAVCERVSAAALLIRAAELGWTPMPGDAPGQALCFEDAAYYRHKGTHWHSTEYDENTGMPLVLPAEDLERARQRRRAYWEKLAREAAARKRTEERARRRRCRHEDAALLASLADDEEWLAAKHGRPISRRAAVRRARKLQRDIVASVTEAFGGRRAGVGEVNP